MDMDEKRIGIFPNATGGYIGGFASLGSSDSQTKLYTDRYEVFVNGDKVGDKIQRTQVEDPDYLEIYLKEQGFQDFHYEVVGDHIEIRSLEDTEQIKNILSGYLSIN